MLWNYIHIFGDHHSQIYSLWLGLCALRPITRRVVQTDTQANPRHTFHIL